MTRPLRPVPSITSPVYSQYYPIPSLNYICSVKLEAMHCWAHYAWLISRRNCETLMHKFWRITQSGPNFIFLLDRQTKWPYRNLTFEDFFFLFCPPRPTLVWFLLVTSLGLHLLYHTFPLSQLNQMPTEINGRRNSQALDSIPATTHNSPIIRCANPMINSSISKNTSSRTPSHQSKW